MIIKDRNIEDKTFIIAEIGNNHEGDISVAKEMIDAATENGADAVKFQTFKTEHYVSHKFSPDRFDKLKGFELTQDQFLELKEYSDAKNIIFFSTPFDLYSASFLMEIAPLLKISSSDFNFYPLLEKVAKSDLPIIFSTGFHNLTQLEKTLDFLGNCRQLTKENTAILHCVGNYPTSPENANLNTIDYYFEKYPNLSIGYSDHTIGTKACEIAVSKGAKIIEKHFTIDNDFSDFHDHKISANPEDFKSLVKAIREIEMYLGTTEKKVNSLEENIRSQIGRKIIATKNLSKGHKIGQEDISWVRLEQGLAAGNEDQILGKVLKEDIESGAPFIPNKLDH